VEDDMPHGFSVSGPGAPIPGSRPTDSDQPTLSDQIDALVNEVYQELFGDYQITSDPTSLQLLTVQCGRCRHRGFVIPIRSGTDVAHLLSLLMRHERRDHDAR
jgi:hypothetical protein